MSGSEPDPWDAVRSVDPGFEVVFDRLADVPRQADHLGRRLRALIGLAVDANVTHLDPHGVRRHIREALLAGASPGEVMEVLECSATVSIHAMNVGVPVLDRVLERRGLRPARELTERQERLKSDFTEQRRYWNATWDSILELDPDLFEAYTDFSAHPWRRDRLSPMVRELIYIAFDTSATHLYEIGLTLHIENALDLGATTEQVLEVMEIATLIGVKSVLVGAPILIEEVAAAAGDHE